VSEDGLHLLEDRSRDVAGQLEVSRQLGFRIDAVTPSVRVQLSGVPGAGGWYSSAVSVELSATDEVSGIATVEYRLDGGSWIANSLVLDVTDGRHLLEVRAMDSAGNVETLTQRIDVDATAPEITSLAPEGLVPTSLVTISWSGSDTVSGVVGYELSLDGGLYESVGSVTSVQRVLTDGDYAVSLRAIDGAGNVAVRETRFRVDSNVFSLTGPYSGAPTFGIAVLGVAAGVLVVRFLVRRRKRRRV